jgi:cytochrome P450
MRQRKLMLPPFHGSRMAGYRDMVADIAREHVARWPRGRALALAPRMQAITLDVVLRVIFGIDEDSARLDPLRERLRRMLTRILGGSSMLAMATAGPARVERSGVYHRWLEPVDDLLLEQIAERRAAPGDDVLSLLLSARGDDGEPMTDQELRDELVTLLVAGHETTATALSWAIERLTRMGPATTPNTGWDALRAGGEPYAEAVAKEALRLRPVLPVVLRNLQRPTTIAGVELEAGTVVTPCIYLVHRRPELYPEPSVFRPERFLGPEPQGGTYTWIPFGGGVRRCLGAAFALMEMRVVLAELAAHVDAVPARPEREPTARRAITLIPARGAEVVLS